MSHHQTAKERIGEALELVGASAFFSAVAEMAEAPEEDSVFEELSEENRERIVFAMREIASACA